jgi:hypothetical protein
MRDGWTTSRRLRAVVLDFALAIVTSHLKSTSPGDSSVQFTAYLHNPAELIFKLPALPCASLDCHFQWLIYGHFTVLSQTDISIRNVSSALNLVLA